MASSDDAVLNRGRVYTHHVRAHEAGRALADVLASAYRHSNRSSWDAHIDGGRVTCDGAPT